MTDDSLQNLTKWVADPRFERMLGRPATLRLAVLAADLSGTGTLQDIAARHGVSKAAMTRHARIVRTLFPVNSKLTVSKG